MKLKFCCAQKKFCRKVDSLADWRKVINYPSRRVDIIKSLPFNEFSRFDFISLQHYQTDGMRSSHERLRKKGGIQKASEFGRDESYSLATGLVLLRNVGIRDRYCLVGPVGGETD